MQELKWKYTISILLYYYIFSTSTKVENINKLNNLFIYFIELMIFINIFYKYILIPLLLYLIIKIAIQNQNINDIEILIIYCKYNQERISK